MYAFVRKPKNLFAIALLLFVVTSIFYVSINLQKLKETNMTSQMTIAEDGSYSDFYNKQASQEIRTIEKSNESLAYKCCTPLNSSFNKNVFFLKTHKTGSSTVQNILLRFALNYSLDVMAINPFGTYYAPLTDDSVIPLVKSPNNKYHILAHHIRYTSKFKDYQYPDGRMVTIMRHPAKLFQSLYSYFHMDQSLGMSFQQFLNASKKPSVIQTETSWMAYRGYNQMSYDLGFNLETYGGSRTAINEFIEKIDREFDLVMITEYMEESLVLLANLMGWPLEYMAHLKMNSRPPDSDQYTLTSHDRHILMELNHVDTQLYHHFLQKFLKCVRQYGEQKLKREVIRLKLLNEELKVRCIKQEYTGVWMSGNLEYIQYIPKNLSDLECLRATLTQYPLELSVVDEQFKRQQMVYASKLFGLNDN